MQGYMVPAFWYARMTTFILWWSLPSSDLHTYQGVLTTLGSLLIETCCILTCLTPLRGVRHYQPKVVSEAMSME